MCGQDSRAIPSMLGILEWAGVWGSRKGTGGKRDTQIYWNPGVTPGLLPRSNTLSYPPNTLTRVLTLTQMLLSLSQVHPASLWWLSAP